MCAETTGNAHGVFLSVIQAVQTSGVLSGMENFPVNGIKNFTPEHPRYGFPARND